MILRTYRERQVPRTGKTRNETRVLKCMLGIRIRDPVFLYPWIRDPG
jgi:hypothetical protein